MIGEVGSAANSTGKISPGAEFRDSSEDMLEKALKMPCNFLDFSNQGSSSSAIPSSSSTTPILKFSSLSNVTTELCRNGLPKLIARAVGNDPKPFA